MIEICGALVFVFAVGAALMTQLRGAIICLWLCSLSVSGMFLSLGAEYLAVLVGLLATLLATVFVFHTELFGRRERVPNWLIAVIAFIVGDAFVVVVWSCVHTLGTGFHTPVAVQAPSLVEIGKYLVTEQFLSLQIMAIIMLTVIVGLGVISRPEVRKK